MKALLTPIFLLILLCSPVTWSADFQKGGTAYNNGDFATALKEFRPLAEQGYASAQFLLGYMYRNGQGVPQDYKTAAKWYTLSAEQGNAGAQSNLGLMYIAGQGVLQDNVYAHMWFNIVASAGDEDATKNRDIVAGVMTPSDISKAQQLARECVAKDYKGC